MLLKQVCAYSNWPLESFELWKWFEYNRPSNEIQKAMRSLFLTAFARIVNDKGLEELETASRTLGGTDDAVEVSNKIASKVIRLARFTYCKGRCLDIERLQYFVPSEVLLQGTIWIHDHSISIEYEDPERRSLGKDEQAVLSLRESFQDDPKRIEMDRFRRSLGQGFDILFDWKNSFDVKRKGKRVRN